MFRSIDRSPRRRNRAVTLIEAVLYISIALALIVGGLVFFQQASTAAKTSTMVRQLSAIISESRVLIKGIPVKDIPTDITSYLIAARAVPPDMVKSASELSNPFGGQTEFYVGTSCFGSTCYPAVQMLLHNVPQGVCARLLTASGGSEFAFGGAGGTTLVSSGYMSGGAAGSVDDAFGRNYIMNATQAGWMCKYGALAYKIKATEPTSATPLSGNVAVFMEFLIDA
jgi:hypothetical protein